MPSPPLRVRAVASVTAALIAATIAPSASAASSPPVAPTGASDHASHASLPVGDARVTTRTARRGWALSCGRAATRAVRRPPWVGRRAYRPARRPVVDGRVRWPHATFTLRVEGRTVHFAGDGLPVGSPTGRFPPKARDDAARYARDAARPVEGRLAGTFPARPARRHRSCLRPDEPIGVARDGVPLLPAFDARGRDAVAREVTDACGGRTDGDGRYYRRAGLACLVTGRRARAARGLVGYARDGFPIYRSRERGHTLRSRDLDACHGHVGTVRLRGRRLRTYHYHLTADFPYTLGCFRGRPAADWAWSGPAVSPAPAPPPPPRPAPTPPPAAPVDVRSDPPLLPAFAPDVGDYVVRCTPGQPVRVAITAPGGASVAVDDAPPRGGGFDSAVTLDAGQAFMLRVHQANGATSEHHVRCLPSDFPGWSAAREGSPQAAGYMVTPSGPTGARTAPLAIVFDANGTPVWWMRTPTLVMDAKLLPDGTFAWSRSFGGAFGTDPRMAFEVHRLDGTLVRTLTTHGSVTDFHEYQLLPDGNVLLMTYKPRDGVDLQPYGGPASATVVDNEIQELRPDGSLAWSWNTKDHVSYAETAGHWWSDIVDHPVKLADGRRAHDIVHMNSIEPDGDRLVVSSRYLDALHAIDRATGKIVWKLGGTPTAESLRIVGDDAHAGAHFGGQHDARVLPDGTLTLHDNGSGLDRPPRALRFRLEERARTATLIEQVSDPEAASSPCCGSARRLPGGNWVMSWGMVSLVTELTPSGARAFRLSLVDGTVFSYRAAPLLPGDPPLAALRAGMDTMHPRDG